MISYATQQLITYNLLSIMKNQIRILGIDDSAFDKYKDKDATVIGVMYRGGDFLDGVMTTKVMVDGDDATVKLIEMINRSKFKTQLRCIMVDGIAVAGFNIINIKKLFELTGIPVIVVMRDYPDLDKIKDALTRLNMEIKIKLLDLAGPIHEHNEIYFQASGINVADAKEILDITCTHSNIPEPLRVAHLIGAALTLGESSGRA